MNQLLKIFIYWLVAIVLFVLLFGLLGPSTRKIDLKEVNFGTAASSEIYFKNLRSFYYNKEEDSASRFSIYTLKELEEADFSFRISIVHNWLQSEAYIFFAKESMNVDEGFCFYVGVKSKKNKVELNQMDSYSQYVFAAKLFEAITSEKEVYLQSEGIKLDNESRKLLRITLKDYFKLVGKIY